MSISDRANAVIATLSAQQREDLVSLHQSDTDLPEVFVPFLVRYEFEVGQRRAVFTDLGNEVVRQILVSRSRPPR